MGQHFTSNMEPLVSPVVLYLSIFYRRIDNIGNNWLTLIRKQPTFRYATTSFPAERRPGNERRNSILIMCYYRDLISTSDWSCHKENFLQPIRSTTQIRIVTRSVSVEFVGSFLRTDIISRGNRRCREMLDVFPGLLNITALQKLSFSTC